MPTKSPAEKAIDRVRLIGDMMKEINKHDYEIRLPPTPDQQRSGVPMRSMVKILGYVLAAMAVLAVVKRAVTCLCDHLLWPTDRSPPASVAEGGTNWSSGRQQTASPRRQLLGNHSSPRPGHSPTAHARSVGASGNLCISLICFLSVCSHRYKC